MKRLRSQHLSRVLEVYSCGVPQAIFGSTRNELLGSNNEFRQRKEFLEPTMLPKDEQKGLRGLTAMEVWEEEVSRTDLQS